MELLSNAPEAGFVTLDIEVAAADVITTAVALLSRDIRMLMEPAFLEEPDTWPERTILERARAALQMALEEYYLPPTRSGVPA